MKINIVNIKEDMIIKNYKALAALLDMPYNRNNKARVLQALEGFVIYEQVGNAFHIKKVRGNNIRSEATEILIKHPVCDILFVDSERRAAVVSKVTTPEEMEEKFPLMNDWNFD